MIEVRRIGEDDWRDWRSLRLAALATDPAAFGSTLADWTGPNDVEARWRARLADSPFPVLLDLDGRPVGMIAAMLEDDVVEVVSLWVDPSARGRGVGEVAIAAIVDFAAGRDVLLSVRTDNGPAVRLYRRSGFVDEGPSPEDPLLERRMRRRG
ncbi:GNAT family N-acetyltransferase [Amnibacterium sp.]|uniref:GNAT family N-acetyltransferase n=1 Tax=Amnibacterium sp. TaxID=1872496 RepID=UPI002613A993|nr:GNAT family N-acetyltransferase [Amnibacterium sp.]MCU1474777.1 family N-acetyltransferase [Amnibacterium sp.]